MAQTEAQKRAQQKWIRKVITITVRVDPEKEPDIMARLKEVKNRSGYIKDLIREDINNHKNVKWR